MSYDFYEVLQKLDLTVLHELILKDEYTSSLLEVIKKTQNEAKECLKNNDIENYKIKSKSLEVLKDEFINHPLVNNYINVKNELNIRLEEIKKQINNLLNKFGNLKKENLLC